MSLVIACVGMFRSYLPFTSFSYLYFAAGAEPRISGHGAVQVLQKDFVGHLHMNILKKSIKIFEALSEGIVAMFLLSNLLKFC